MEKQENIVKYTLNPGLLYLWRDFEKLNSARKFPFSDRGYIL